MTIVPLSEIVELYVDRQMTMKQIADHFGVTKQAVWYRLKSAGLRLGIGQLMSEGIT